MSRISVPLDPDIRNSILISLGISLALALVATISYFTMQPEIPFFYSLARPEDQLAHKAWIFFFPGFSLIITLVHTLLLMQFADLKNLIRQLFGWATMIMQLLLLVSMIRIILLVT